MSLQTATKNYLYTFISNKQLLIIACNNNNNNRNMQQAACNQKLAGGCTTGANS